MCAKNIECRQKRASSICKFLYFLSSGGRDQKSLFTSASIKQNSFIQSPKHYKILQLSFPKYVSFSAFDNYSTIYSYIGKCVPSSKLRFGFAHLTTQWATLQKKYHSCDIMAHPNPRPTPTLNTCQLIKRPT